MSHPPERRTRSSNVLVIGTTGGTPGRIALSGELKGADAMHSPVPCNPRSVWDVLNRRYLSHEHLLRVGFLALLLALAACQQDGGGNGY